MLRADWKFNYSCSFRRPLGDNGTIDGLIGKAGSMRVGVAAVLFLVFAPAALAAGIDSYEKIKDADAYNACLANYGPAVGDHKFTAAPLAASEAEAPHPGQVRPPKRRNAWDDGLRAPKQGLKRLANGRMRIEIFPGK